MIRRFLAILLWVTSLVSSACGGTLIPPSDEVTTRMNAKDEEALTDAAPRPDAGVKGAEPHEDTGPPRALGPRRASCCQQAKPAQGPQDVTVPSRPASLL